MTDQIRQVDLTSSRQIPTFLDTHMACITASHAEITFIKYVQKFVLSDSGKLIYTKPNISSSFLINGHSFEWSGSAQNLARGILIPDR